MENLVKCCDEKRLSIIIILIKMIRLSESRFLLSLITTTIFIIYFLLSINHNETTSRNNLRNTWKSWREDGRMITEMPWNIETRKPRQRLVNDVGSIVAEEQPNLKELRSANKIIQTTSKENQKLVRNNLLHNSTTNDDVNKNRKIGVIEDDPRIDDNALPISYKFYVNENMREPTCTVEAPIRHIVSLFTHRTAIQKVNNIFYRYGDFNGLFFALPKPHSLKYYWPLRFHSSYIDKTLLDKSTPNFLINGARNNFDGLKGLTTKSSFFMAMLRNPVNHFAAIFRYTDMPRFMRVVSNVTDLLGEFVKDPLINIEKVINKTKTFEPRFHLLKNPQLFDLGYELHDYKTSRDMKMILLELEEHFDFVLIEEYFVESLVILQRFLCWQLEDMVYVKSYIENHRDVEKYSRNILEWNKEDVQLYEHFNRTLWKRIQEHEDAMFWDDVARLKKMSEEITKECQANREKKSILSKLKNRRGNLKKNILENLNRICERMNLDDRDYVTLLKIKQKEKLRNDYETTLREHFIMNGTDGKFLYVLNKIIEGVKNINETEHNDYNNTSTLRPLNTKEDGLYSSEMSLNDENETDEDIEEISLSNL